MKSSQIIGNQREKSLDARDILIMARTVIDLLINLQGGQNDRLVQKKEERHDNLMEHI